MLDNIFQDFPDVRDDLTGRDPIVFSVTIRRRRSWEGVMYQWLGQRSLVHEYGQIDHELLYKTAKEDIPEFISTIED